MRKKSNILFSLDYCFMENIIFIEVFWITFYFVTKGYVDNIAGLSSIYPFSIILGSFTLIPLFSFCQFKKSLLTSGLLVANFLIMLSFIFLNSEKSNLVYYIIGFFLYNYFLIYPYSRIVSN